jgi:hypothetical protein
MKSKGQNASFKGDPEPPVWPDWTVRRLAGNEYRILVASRMTG